LPGVVALRFARGRCDQLPPGFSPVHHLHAGHTTKPLRGSGDVIIGAARPPSAGRIKLRRRHNARTQTLRPPPTPAAGAGSIHGGPAVTQFLARHPRLLVERFPAYAPELNPDELVWNYLKGELANGRPDTVNELLDDLTQVTRRLRRAPHCYGRRWPRPAASFFGLTFYYLCNGQ
jgi:hypothetical protein